MIWAGSQAVIVLSNFENLRKFNTKDSGWFYPVHILPSPGSEWLNTWRVYNASIYGKYSLQKGKGFFY